MNILKVLFLKLNSLFTPVSAIQTQTTRLTSSSNKFYLPRYRTTNCKKVLSIKELKFGTQYLMKLKSFCFIKLK